MFLYRRTAGFQGGDYLSAAETEVIGKEIRIVAADYEARGDEAVLLFGT